jgi:phosphotransferase system enzyme I (PtsP)
MISNLSELDAALALIHRAYRELTEEENYNLKLPPLGAMIEVPAAVYQVKEIGSRVDFMSVGTNDLTQYLLAVDRNNPRVAEIYDSLHPSVLRALKTIQEQAVSVDCELSVCGEMAGDPVSAVVLMGLGYRNLSMSASSLLRVKSLMLKVSREIAEDWVDEALCLSDAASVGRFMSEALAPYTLKQSKLAS